jgi:hypothetical protein
MGIRVFVMKPASLQALARAVQTALEPDRGSPGAGQGHPSRV